MVQIVYISITVNKQLRLASTNWNRDKNKLLKTQYLSYNYDLCNYGHVPIVTNKWVCLYKVGVSTWIGTSSGPLWAGPLSHPPGW